MNKYNFIDRLNRKYFKSLENKKLIKKSISFNTTLKNSIRNKITSKLNEESKKHSKVILTKRCILTGRKSQINKNFNVSRLCLLRLFRKCSIPGIRKSSW